MQPQPLRTNDQIDGQTRSIFVYDELSETLKAPVNAVPLHMAYF